MKVVLEKHNFNKSSRNFSFYKKWIEDIIISIIIFTLIVLFFNENEYDKGKRLVRRRIYENDMKIFYKKNFIEIKNQTNQDFNQNFPAFAAQYKLSKTSHSQSGIYLTFILYIIFILPKISYYY